jgi:hypothetical protein
VLNEIQSQWSDMLSDSDFQIPFYSVIWYQKWFECFGAGKDLFVVGAWDASGNLVAVAPLVKTETCVLGVRLREITFMYNSIAPRSSILYRHGPQGIRATEAIFAELMRQSHDWDCIRLVNVDATLPYIVGLDSVVDKGKYKLIIKEGRISPYLRIDGSFDEYFQRHFNSKQKNDIRRNIRKFHSHPDCAIVKYTKVQDIPLALDLSFQVSQASWKSHIGSDMGSTPENRRFYSDISKILAQRGQIAIWIALHKQRPIASQYQLLADGTAYLVITDFDEQYGSFSPGTALLYHIIENLHAENFNEFDLCGDPFQYKLRWTKNMRKHVNVRIYNKNPRSRLMYYYTAKLLPIFKAIAAKTGKKR